MAPDRAKRAGGCAGWDYVWRLHQRSVWQLSPNLLLIWQRFSWLWLVKISFECRAFKQTTAACVCVCVSVCVIKAPTETRFWVEMVGLKFSNLLSQSQNASANICWQFKWSYLIKEIWETFYILFHFADKCFKLWLCAPPTSFQRKILTYKEI